MSLSRRTKLGISGSAIVVLAAAGTVFGIHADNCGEEEKINHTPIVSPAPSQTIDDLMTPTPTNQTPEPNLYGPRIVEGSPAVALYDEKGNIVWAYDASKGIEDKSSKWTSGRIMLTRDNFECLDVSVDEKYNQLIVIGNDTKEGIVGNITLIDEGTGKADHVYWHKGTINSVTLFDDYLLFVGENMERSIFEKAQEVNPGARGPPYPVIGVLERTESGLDLVAYNPVVFNGGNADDIEANRLPDGRVELNFTTSLLNGGGGSHTYLLENMLKLPKDDIYALYGVGSFELPQELN